MWLCFGWDQFDSVTVTTVRLGKIHVFLVMQVEIVTGFVSVFLCFCKCVWRGPHLDAIVGKIDGMSQFVNHNRDQEQLELVVGTV